MLRRQIGNFVRRGLHGNVRTFLHHHGRLFDNDVRDHELRYRHDVDIDDHGGGRVGHCAHCVRHGPDLGEQRRSRETSRALD